jgi:hypothetical protein
MVAARPRHPGEGAAVKRHRIDFVSLVFGVLFLATALVFVGGHRRLTAIPVAWLWAIPMLAIGLSAVLTGIRRAIDQHGTPVNPHDVQETAPTADDPPE